MFSFASKMLNTIMGNEEQEGQGGQMGVGMGDMGQQHGMGQAGLRNPSGSPFPPVRPSNQMGPMGSTGGIRAFGGPPTFTGPRPSPGVRAGPPVGPARPMTSAAPGPPHRFNGPQPPFAGARGPQGPMRAPMPGAPGQAPGAFPPGTVAPGAQNTPQGSPRVRLPQAQRPLGPRAPQAGGPGAAQVPSVDLSHLSAEERAMIQNVMAKAEQMEKETPAPMPPSSMAAHAPTTAHPPTSTIHPQQQVAQMPNAGQPPNRMMRPDDHSFTGTDMVHAPTGVAPAQSSAHGIAHSVHMQQPANLDSNARNGHLKQNETDLMGGKGQTVQRWDNESELAREDFNQKQIENQMSSVKSTPGMSTSSNISSSVAPISVSSVPNTVHDSSIANAPVVTSLVSNSGFPRRMSDGQHSTFSDPSSMVDKSSTSINRTRLDMLSMNMRNQHVDAVNTDNNFTQMTSMTSTDQTYPSFSNPLESTQVTVPSFPPNISNTIKSSHSSYDKDHVDPPQSLSPIDCSGTSWSQQMPPRRDSTTRSTPDAVREILSSAAQLESLLDHPEVVHAAKIDAPPLISQTSAEPQTDEKADALMQQLSQLQSAVDSTLKRHQRDKNSEFFEDVMSSNRSPSSLKRLTYKPENESNRFMSPLSPEALESPESPDIPGPRKAIVLKDYDLDDYKSSSDEESDSDSDKDQVYYDHNPGEVYTIPEEEDEGGSPTGGDLVTSLKRSGPQVFGAANKNIVQRPQGMDIQGVRPLVDQRYPLRPQLRPQRSVDNRQTVPFSSGPSDLDGHNVQQPLHQHLDGRDGLSSMDTPSAFASNQVKHNQLHQADNQNFNRPHEQATMGGMVKQPGMGIVSTASHLQQPGVPDPITSQGMKDPMQDMAMQQQQPQQLQKPMGTQNQMMGHMQDGWNNSTNVGIPGQQNMDPTSGMTTSTFDPGMQGYSSQGQQPQVPSSQHAMNAPRPQNPMYGSGDKSLTASGTMDHANQQLGPLGMDPTSKIQVGKTSLLQPQQQEQLQAQIQQQQQLQEQFLQQRKQAGEDQTLTGLQPPHPAPLQPQTNFTQQPQNQVMGLQSGQIGNTSGAPTQPSLHPQSSNHMVPSSMAHSLGSQNQQNLWSNAQQPRESMNPVDQQSLPQQQSQFPSSQQNVYSHSQSQLPFHPQPVYAQPQSQLSGHKVQGPTIPSNNQQHIDLSTSTAHPQHLQQTSQISPMTSQAGAGSKSISGLLADFSKVLGLGSSPRPSPVEEKPNAFPLGGSTSVQHPEAVLGASGNLQQPGIPGQWVGSSGQIGSVVQQSAFASVQDPAAQSFLAQQQRNQQQQQQQQQHQQGLLGESLLHLPSGIPVISKSQQLVVHNQKPQLVQQQQSTLNAAGVGVVGALSPAQAHMYQQQMALQHQQQHMKKSRRSHQASSNSDIKRDGLNSALYLGSSQPLQVAPGTMTLGTLTPAVVTSLGTFIGGGQAILGTSLLPQPVAVTPLGTPIGTPAGTPRSGRDPCTGDSSDTLSETDSQKSLRMRRKLPCLPADQEAAPLPSTKKRDRQKAQEFRSLSPMRMTSADGGAFGFSSYPLSALQLSRPSASETNLRKLTGGVSVADPVPRPGSALGLLQGSSIVNSVGVKREATYPIGGSFLSSANVLSFGTQAGFTNTTDLSTNTPVIPGIYAAGIKSDSWAANMAELAAALPPDLRHLLNKNDLPCDPSANILSGLKGNISDTGLSSSDLPAYMKSLREQLQEERRQLLSEERRRLEALRERDRELGARLDAVTGRGTSDAVGRQRTELTCVAGISRSTGASPLLTRKSKGHRRQMSDPKILTSSPFSSSIPQDGNLDGVTQDYDRFATDILRLPYKSYEFESLESTSRLKPLTGTGLKDWDPSQSYLPSSWATGSGPVTKTSTLPAGTSGLLRETAINSLQTELCDDSRGGLIGRSSASGILNRRSSDGEAWPLPSSVPRSPAVHRRHGMRKHRKPRSWHPSPYVSEDEEEEEDIHREEKKAMIKAEIARRRQQMQERTGLAHHHGISGLREEADIESHSILKSVDHVIRDQFSRTGAYGAQSTSTVPFIDSAGHTEGIGLSLGAAIRSNTIGLPGATSAIVISPCASEEDRSMERIASTFRGEECSAMLYERYGEMSPMATDTESINSEFGAPAAMPLLPDMPTNIRTRSRRLLEDLGSSPVAQYSDVGRGTSGAAPSHGTRFQAKNKYVSTHGYDGSYHTVL